MTDFFNRLAGRSMGITQVVQPRIRSRFAAPVREDADTEVVRETWMGQSEEFPVATRLHDERDRGHSLPRLHGQDALLQTESRAATRVVAADGVESEGAAVQGGREPVRAETLPAGSRGQMNTIETELEVVSSRAALSMEFPAVPLLEMLDARRTERPVEADGHVEPARQLHTAIPAPSSLTPPAHDLRRPPLDMRSATRRSDQENPSRGASLSLPLDEAAPARRAQGHLVRDLELGAPPAPEIHVSIGRIEVRAMPPPAAQLPRARPPSVGPALSLEAYLQKRLEGSR